MARLRHTDWPDRPWIVRHGQSAGNVARDRAEVADHHLIDLEARDADTPLSGLRRSQAQAWRMVGGLGFLAREIAGEVPALLQAPRPARSRREGRPAGS